MNAFIKPDDLQAGVIAAHRYLAFLDQERYCLIQEIDPNFKTGDRFFVPCDRHVNCLFHNGSPIDRAETVLRAVGVDPHAHDAWVDHIGVDFSQIPIIGTVGEKRKKRLR